MRDNATDTEIEAEALRFWREREMQFPPRVRRMDPDEIDKASGAWCEMLRRAALSAAREG